MRGAHGIQEEIPEMKMSFFELTQVTKKLHLWLSWLANWMSVSFLASSFLASVMHSLWADTEEKAREKLQLHGERKRSTCMDFSQR